MWRPEVKVRSLPQLSSILFFWSVSQWSPSSSCGSVDWLVFTFLVLGVGACFHAQLLLGRRGSESRFSCSHSKHVIHWSIPSSCTPYCLVGSEKICIIIEVYGSVWPHTPEDQQAEALQPWSSFSYLNHSTKHESPWALLSLSSRSGRSCELRGCHGSNEPNECILPSLTMLYFWEVGGLGTSPLTQKQGLTCVYRQGSASPSSAEPLSKDNQVNTLGKTLHFVQMPWEDLLGWWAGHWGLRAALPGIGATRRQGSLWSCDISKFGFTKTPFFLIAVHTLIQTILSELNFLQ